MLQSIRKYLVLPTLLLSIFFFVGISCSSVALANQNQAEQCCDKDTAPEVPTDGGACLDCGCPSCVLVLVTPNSSDNAHVSTTMSTTWVLSDTLPSGFIRSIDYPPEVL